MALYTRCRGQCGRYPRYPLQNITHINISECFQPLYFNFKLHKSVYCIAEGCWKPYSEIFQQYQSSMELNHRSIPQSDLVLVLAVCIISEPTSLRTFVIYCKGSHVQTMFTYLIVCDFVLFFRRKRCIDFGSSRKKEIFHTVGHFWKRCSSPKHALVLYEPTAAGSSGYSC